MTLIGAWTAFFDKYTCVDETLRTRDARGARTLARARAFLPALASLVQIRDNSNSIFQKREVVKFKFSSIEPTYKIYMTGNVFGLITGEEEKQKYSLVSQRLLSSYTLVSFKSLVRFESSRHRSLSEALRVNLSINLIKRRQSLIATSQSGELTNGETCR